MIRRDLIEDMDRGEARAVAHANRLTRETGIKHRAVQRSWTGLVGGADWWEVHRLRFRLYWSHVASYNTFDGGLVS